MKNPAWSREKTLPTEKTLADLSGIATWPTSGIATWSTSGFLLSRPTQKLWFIWVQPSWCPFCSRSDVSSLCWPRRTQWPQLRHTGWRFPYSGLWICLQKPALAASLATGASLATSPSGHLGVLGLRSGEGGGHAIFSYGCSVGALYGRSFMMLSTIFLIPLLFISSAGFSLVQSTRSLSLLAVQTHLALLRASQMDRPDAS